MVSYAPTIRESLRSAHRLARLKPGKLKRVPNEVENAPIRVYALSWVTQGFSRASDETREKDTPSSFAREQVEGKERMIEYAVEIGSGSGRYCIGNNRMRQH